MLEIARRESRWNSLRDYLTGAYFYNIVIDGVPVKAGMFTIVK